MWRKKNNGTCKTHHGKKAKPVWTHMQDEGQHAGEGRDVLNNVRRRGEEEFVENG